MKAMSKSEAYDFIMYGTRTGKLATVRGDGRPHVAPIWFVVAGEDLIFNTWHTSVKAENMRREERVALCVDEERAPYAFVILEGRVELTEDPTERLAWATKIARRYMGEELAKVYGERNAVEGELIVRLCPDKIIAKKDVAGWD